MHEQQLCSDVISLHLEYSTLSTVGYCLYILFDYLRCIFCFCINNIQLIVCERCVPLGPCWGAQLSLTVSFSAWVSSGTELELWSFCFQKPNQVKMSQNYSNKPGWFGKLVLWNSPLLLLLNLFVETNIFSYIWIENSKEQHLFTEFLFLHNFKYLHCHFWSISCILAKFFLLNLTPYFWMVAYQFLQKYEALLRQFLTLIKCSLSSKWVYYNDFWRSCDTEDWSHDAENTALHHIINDILTYIQIAVILNCNHISECYSIFDQIYAA